MDYDFAQINIYILLGVLRCVTIPTIANCSVNEHFVYVFFTEIPRNIEIIWARVRAISSTRSYNEFVIRTSSFPISREIRTILQADLLKISLKKIKLSEEQERFYGRFSEFVRDLTYKAAENTFISMATLNVSEMRSVWQGNSFWRNNNAETFAFLNNFLRCVFAFFFFLFKSYRSFSYSFI